MNSQHSKRIVGTIILLGDVTLRGVSQVFMLNSPLIGLLIALAGVFDTWKLLIAAIMGSFCSTLSVFLLNELTYVSKTKSRSGVRFPIITGDMLLGVNGYDGCLFGLGLVSACILPNPDATVADWFLCALLSSAAGPVRHVLVPLFSRSFPERTPVCTLAFNLCHLVFLRGLQPPSNFGGVFFVPPVTPSVLAAPSSNLDAGELFLGALKAIGQINFIGHWGGGLVILAALMLGKWTAGVGSYIGGVLGALTAFSLTGVMGPSIGNGLAGYNAALFGCVMGHMVLDIPPSSAPTFGASTARKRPQLIYYTVLGVLGALGMPLVERWVSGLVWGGAGGPVGTLPFVLLTIGLAVMFASAPEPIEDYVEDEATSEVEEDTPGHSRHSSIPENV